jgi:hypothetical protein
MSRSDFITVLDRYAEQGRHALLWLRDDDAVKPSAPLSRLLDLSGRWNVPMTIAAIPAHATPALADLLQPLKEIAVAVHGWDHLNHAPPGQKKEELGLHRSQEIVLQSLHMGLRRIVDLFGRSSVALMVPPWNRIDPQLIGHLPARGYKALSIFGPERSLPGLALVNTHLDIIDWKGSRGGRSFEALYGEAATWLNAEQGPSIRLGVLTHHLVHDEAAWAFLEDFLALTASHSACRWLSVRDLIDEV